MTSRRNRPHPHLALVREDDESRDKGNPLLRLWRQVHPGRKTSDRMSLLASDWPPVAVFSRSLLARDEACRKYSWAVPTDEALLAIASHSPLIEIGAGTGYWAGLLAARGADVVAYDICPPTMANNEWHDGVRTTFHEVRYGGPRVIPQHPGRTLFLCWPPHSTSMATRCLRRYKGKTVIYVGEWRAATADDEFHDILEHDFEEAALIAVPQWFGIHDELFIFTRKGRRS